MKTMAAIFPPVAGLLVISGIAAGKCFTMKSTPLHRHRKALRARDIRDQCRDAGVAFFFKQVGGIGRDKGGILLNGREWNEYPRQIAE